MKVQKPLERKELAASQSLSAEKLEFAAMYMFALQDLQTSVDYLNSEKSEFWRRIVVRSVFSFVEFTSFRLRFLLLAGANDGTFQLSPDELLLLKDELPDLNENGNIRSRDNFFRFEKYFKFTLKLSAKYFQPTQQPDFGDGGWEALRESLKVRDLITHPKTWEHLSVSEEEVTKLEKGLDWYIDTLSLLISTWSTEATDTK